MEKGEIELSIYLTEEILFAERVIAQLIGGKREKVQRSARQCSICLQNSEKIRHQEP